MEAQTERRGAPASPAGLGDVAAALARNPALSSIDQL